MWKTRVCDLLGIKYPILEGGMARAGNAELAAAVSNAGALGMLVNPNWVPEEQRVENLRNTIRKTKSLTNQPFGINMTLFRVEELAERLINVAVEEGVKAIVCSGGSPRLFTKKIKDAGAISIHVVGNVKQAKTAEVAGVDIVVGEGYEAGGNNSPDELTTFVLVPYIADAVKIPVVAAGGIADARGFVAALALGAEGVQIGSLFLATKECHVPQKYKEAIVTAEDTDTTIVRRVLGRRQRVLKNDFTIQLADMDRRGAAEEMKAALSRGRDQGGQVLGDAFTHTMPVGQIAGMIKEIMTTAQVVQQVIGGTDPVMKKCLELEKS
ncbi:NAD(P)H-dependent flavin oxidoreductase [Chloroflexota bacterium]